MHVAMAHLPAGLSQQGPRAVLLLQRADTGVQRGDTRVQRGDADVTQAEAMPHQDDKSLPEAIAAATAIAA